MKIQVFRKTKFGKIGLTEANGAIVRLWLPSEITGQSEDTATPLIEKAFQELDEYFKGTRRTFTISMKPIGTPFMLSAWQALVDIPYGQTATYGEIANRIGHPGAARAVGMACSRNPLALFVPCHRVVATSGLGGFREGLPMKRELLALEEKNRALLKQPL